MDQFSISQLAQFSGIKAHTIRMWEQRYHALKPNRSVGNTRSYDNSQLRRLLNIVSLMEGDYKVSELCNMSDKKLYKLIVELENNNRVYANELDEPLISQLIAAGMSFDEAYFDKTFSHCILKYGMKHTYSKIIYPMLVRIGFMWTTDALPPAQEHYISNLIRQKLSTAIDSLAPAKLATDSWLLFLPENEFHEIGLLFAHYLVRLSGKKVIYLGSNVPLQSVSIAVKSASPANLLLFFVSADLPENIQEYLDKLSLHFSTKNIFVAAEKKVTDSLKAGKRILFLNSVEDLEQKLTLQQV